MGIKDEIDKKKLPKHVAVIMDGNGRWAKERGEDRLVGHHKGVEAVKELCNGASELGIKYLTVYAFSKENWSRPKEEVFGLMSLLVKTLREQLNTLLENKVRLNVIGDIESLPENVQKELSDVIKETEKNTGPKLNLALSYSARWELTEAARKLSSKVRDGLIRVDEINEDAINQELTTAGMAEPELLIRTGGEKRLSNFMLWQLSYAEFYFIEKYWPDFTKEDFFYAVADYQKRQRRFGKTGEQTLNEL
jgi:undecaprenyl diphosphate synthase